MRCATLARSGAVLLAGVLLAFAAGCRALSPTAQAEAQEAAQAGPLLAVGDLAPDFTLPDSHGKPVTLGSFRGRCGVVLAFYPQEQRPICSRQLCMIRDGFAPFREAGVVVLGINPQSVSFHRRHIEVQKYPFEILSDTNEKVCAAYRTQAPRTVRTLYCIGKDGRIVLAERGVPTNKAILAALGG